MSSTYKILCLSHDPAIVLGWPEFQSGQGGHLTSVEAVQRGVEGHPGCDLLVGRYSSPLIEVCCPSPASGPKPAGVRCCHSQAQWVDADWLRLAALAYEEPDGSQFRKAVERVAPCWTKVRLCRLRAELGLDEETP